MTRHSNFSGMTSEVRVLFILINIHANFIYRLKWGGFTRTVNQHPIGSEPASLGPSGAYVGKDILCDIVYTSPPLEIPAKNKQLLFYFYKNSSISLSLFSSFSIAHFLYL